ncbi:uncharacterized protein K452DRAFT_315333 [Aplosporella prunicola CBS 121167]|uniref:Uncharacterized protein n=1 Tax=Aplosporella prunicola CBS 121167 TaxID=1176127 RepID=A0A6A6BS07_9PEZI|nr:uncharacterized protein K452DRAFT_315333 [Aplosporella prunicola CBS 121167]KAF2146075.1 hypothetical protein K452DRAFT_315333 [Aplosporella prunicola CBS 121167]
MSQPNKQDKPSRSDNNDDEMKGMSKYQIVKEGWGNRPNFQASYGLKMTPEDIEEGNRILETFQELDDAKTNSEQNQQGKTGKNA